MYLVRRATEDTLCAKKECVVVQSGSLFGRLVGVCVVVSLSGCCLVVVVWLRLDVGFWLLFGCCC